MDRLTHAGESHAYPVQQEGVTAAPVLTYTEQYAKPYFKARRTYEQVGHPCLPGEVICGIPWKLSRTLGAIRRPAPLVREHNAYVFSGLMGLPEADICDGSSTLEVVPRSIKGEEAT